MSFEGLNLCIENSCLRNFGLGVLGVKGFSAGLGFECEELGFKLKLTGLHFTICSDLLALGA